MELTIEQALEQGVTAHREGKLEEADRLYRAILQSQPAHPDANHNLGVLAVSVNKADAALPLFKSALEANPKIEQFWLSYIDALIKEKQFDNAKEVFGQAKKQGVAGEKLNVLETQLISIIHTDNIGSVSPSKKQLSSLLEHYQNERFNDAEKLASSITQKFPKHQFGWKVLGAVLKKTGRVSESLVAIQKSVQLVPQDSEAHYNLGITLTELGRLNEAEVSYTQAIALKPDYAGAYNNLGNTLKELGRLEEAEASYKQAISMKPDYAAANCNLGIMLTESGRLDEAEASYRQAIALKPDYAEAHNNLGATLQKLGRLDEAEVSYTQAIALKPDFAEAHSNLGFTLQELGRLEESEVSYKQAIAFKPGLAAAHSSLGITLQKLGKLDEAEVSYTQAIALKPDDAEAHNRLLRCLYLLDKQSLFFDKLDYLINEETANATIGSLTCRSALKYGVEKPNLFCREPLQYVLHIDMNTQYDFEEIFVEKARLILNENRISNRKQSLLINGSQTSGNLFDIKNSFTEQIQKAIRLEIEKYRINFKDSKDGLIKQWPIEYSLYGWLISMKSGGELKPHIHSNGWLSGSLYINVPPKLKAESGSLVVSLGEEKDATDTRVNLEKIINVVTGSLVLFPASLTHYTIPFEAEEERIVLAFDVKQK
jgi:tetratricopeptide (TPR) repeat protein